MNVASCTQGITKRIGVPVIVTESTVQKMGTSFATRRLAQSEVVGVEGVVNSFQLFAEPQQDLTESYEQALQAFENTDFENAARILADLVSRYRKDRPTVMLLGRTVECLTQTSQDFDPVWHLDQK